ncbi:HEAT repeat-containing protein 1-like [Tachypleus tridentatus]|uniref:HEAT repeat-containing protein 1-like n=1 Tax=Tachypleus tridentatus TaxID=6853 RepID=UPI003FD4BDA2
MTFCEAKGFSKEGRWIVGTFVITFQSSGFVFRFHIHVYNVDDLIACILHVPRLASLYAVIQLLNLNDATSRWHWLKPLQKPGVPLPKVTLLNHCYKDISFMKFICNLVPETLKIHQLKTHPAHRTVTSFYMSSVLGALEYADKVTEEIVATLLPFVLKGLKSGDKDYCAATYMILCQLMRKTHLMSSLCEKLVVKISKHLQPELTMQGFVCLLVIFQYQNLRRFPRLGFLALCSKDVIGSLEHLCHEYHLGPILRPFFQKLVPASLSETAKSVKKRRLLSSLIKL